MILANLRTIGGYVSGETKLGIILPLLDGGDSLDVGVIFDIHPKSCITIMCEVLLHWIIDIDIGHINMHDYLKDDAAMKRVSEVFSRRSNGVIRGAIGVIDGWLVRIIKPSFHRDGIKNITSLFSR